MTDEPRSVNKSSVIDDITDGSLSFGIVGALRFIADEVQMGRVIVEIPVFFTVLFVVGRVLRSSLTTGVIVKKPRK